MSEQTYNRIQSIAPYIAIVSSVIGMISLFIF